MKDNVVILFVVTTMLLAAPVASADTLTASLGGPLTEVSHAVRLSREDGVARFRVRRTFANSGTGHDEAVVTIQLPAGAAATALRIRVGQRWYDGELMEAERAAELYRELTGVGPHTPRDPALLSWMWTDQLQLRVFPVPPGSTATVEYTLTVPTQYRDGISSITYPLADPASGLAEPVLTVAASAGAGVRIDEQPVASEQPVVLRATEPDPRCALLGMSPSCVVSGVDLPQAVARGAVTFRANVRHTFASDLRIAARTPSGQHIDLWANEGAGDNDVELARLVDLVREEPAGTWFLGVEDEVGLDVGVLDAFAVQPTASTSFGAVDLPRYVPDAGAEGGFARVSLVEEPTTKIVARLGRVSLKGADASRLEVDVPAQLSTMPTQPHVVFVVDASHSAGEEGLEEQRRLAAGFLQHVPDARVEVVAYRRKTRAIFGEFVAADEVESRWNDARNAGRLDPGNGSNLDDALKLAYELLGKERGDRYVVAFTDDRLRPSWPSKLSFGGRPNDSITTHMLVLGGTSPGLERDDDHRLAPIPLADGGILVHTGETVKLDAKQFAAETLHLVRPTRIDGAWVDGFEIDPVLWEGSSVRKMDLSAASPSLRLRGKLWAKRVDVAPRRTGTFDRATAAWVFSHALHDALTPEQMMAFAMRGRAVTPVTSYIAIEPGVRPSTAGLGWGTATGGMGGLGGGGQGLMSPSSVLPKLRDLLEPAAKSCRAQHPGTAVSLTLHTTLIELVDVELRSDPGPLAACVIEAAWELALPSAFAAVPSSSEEVSL